MQRLGRHLIVELFDCAPEILNDLEAVQTILLAVARRARATIVGSTFHQFSPFGLSGVVIMSESHVSIHTWPEHRYTAADIFSRGEAFRPDVAVESVIAALGAQRVSVLEVQRGILPTSLGPGAVAAARTAPATYEHGRATGQPRVLG
ncbi:MAG TPA: adenosylmethionine decarboxylase [Methylomirabilota bacterium]|nr:adenosylmethionine decarboxylase [Methylomirabilota bacterium]